MKKAFVFWVEEYFYNPTSLQKIISLLFLPLSWLYCFVVYLRFQSKTPIDFGVDIVSVGNLTVGGSGKTPLVTALASHYENAAVILRGYGRQSKGLYVVKDRKNILCDVKISGDEAMIYAQKLPNAIVIVSEERKIAIDKAKELGAKVIFLDDAYSKHDIKKLDLLIKVESSNSRCLPAGPFRERAWSSKKSVMLEENVDFKRHVALKGKCDKMSLVTAIARPGRLDKYLPPVVNKNYFEDHHAFSKTELEEILKRDKAESLLVTYKDFVKMEAFGLPVSLLDLEMQVDAKVFEFIDLYRKNNTKDKID
ncbi:tetraacyldisaccharide 4'-kinase [bacterium]|nr:tetraacyldisaccharide 4'-kinase [bacterium]MBU1433733.1 tetraacyldisaccharide 4'-kinase [bacterium]MBU1503808.1 tetraacyldisaccharide 4'-kinase [bacterium]